MNDPLWAGKLKQARESRESLSAAYLRDMLDRGCTGMHESLMKSYMVLQNVKEWLRLGVPPAVILQMIDDAYSERKE